MTGKYFCGYHRSFVVNRFVTTLFDCMLVKMILSLLKSSLEGICKLNDCWNLFQRKLCIISWLVLFMENIMEYFVHVQTVCIRPLLRGEGPRDEATMAGCSQAGQIFVMMVDEV